MSGDDVKAVSEAVDAALSEMKLEGDAEPATPAQPNAESHDARSHPQQSASPIEPQPTTPTSLSFQPQPQTESSDVLGLIKSEVQDEVISTRSATPTMKNEKSGSPEAGDSEFEEHKERAKAPKLFRKGSSKMVFQPPPLFDHLEDATAEATSSFQVIRDCIYGSKYMGSADHDALGCDCNEEYRDGVNHACGEDSNCINRLTKIECVDDECNCGPNCQNQRFQRKQFAKVSVIKTEKKGFGLRADTDLEPNAFIFEYIGEVINEPTFRRRTIQYDQEGVKHFYFMSLTKSEFVDATKKGNLGRFCNHSCNPNCYVDKWVVGDKLRMGIFAERHIKAGEELVFNYNVDRYGADPQPCYCGEPNCTGFLGGKTQTERATKLSHTTVEALGIDDGDGWDTAVAKKPRKKKTGEADEEWVSSTQPKPLNTRGVASLMATLMQCKEKWIVVKLLDRVIKANDDRVYSEVLRFHGYQTMRSAINQWKEDNNVILQVLTILYKLPRVSKNKIVDAKIEPTIHELTTSEHEDIASESKRLLDEWSKLQVAYRIPRKKNDPAAQAAYVEAVKKADPELWAKLVAEYTPRRPKVEEKPAVATKPAISAPTGPRGTIPQRGPIRAPPPRRIGPLPSGWHEAVDGNGRTYYYSKTGLTAWQRPTIPVREPVEKPASGLTMAQQNQRDLQAIIDDVMKQASNKPAKAPATPATQEEAKPEKSEKDEKWRSWPIEQQMKQYEKTIAPVIQYFVDKYKKSFPKDVLKQHAKQLAKKVVASDFKRDRVDNPSKLSPMQKDTIKSFAREFFQSAFKKHKERERQKRKDKEQANQLKLNGARSESKDADSNTPSETPARTPLYADNEGKIDVSDDEGHDIDMPNATPADSDESRKRKADDELDDGNNKRVRESQGESNGDFMIPPPPPSPPPVGFGTPSIYNDMRQIDGGMDAFALQTPRDVQTPREESKEDAEMRAAQEELEKENEANAAMETKAAVDDVNTQAFLQNDIALSGTGDITDGASTSKNDERKDGFSASQPTAAI